MNQSHHSARAARGRHVPVNVARELVVHLGVGVPRGRKRRDDTLFSVRAGKHGPHCPRK